MGGKGGGGWGGFCGILPCTPPPDTPQPEEEEEKKEEDKKTEKLSGWKGIGGGGRGEGQGEQDGYLQDSQGSQGVFSLTQEYQGAGSQEGGGGLTEEQLERSARNKAAALVRRQERECKTRVEGNLIK